MSAYTAGSVIREKRWIMWYAIGAAMLLQFTGLLVGHVSAEVRWEPSIGANVQVDDNVRFARVDEEDDTMYLVIPALKMDYDTEISSLETKASAGIRRYSENDQFDDTTYRLDLRGRTKPTERFLLNGDYEFIKDTTLDEELLEIGRVFTREDRNSHKIGLSPRFNLTERLGIGLTGRYRTVLYDSDDLVDYSAWNVGLPVRWSLDTQVDTIFMSPGYSVRDSDRSRSESYTLNFGWDHETTERLNFVFTLGARYTETEILNNNQRNNDTASTDDDKKEVWGAVAKLRLNYDFLTGDLVLDFDHNLQNTAVGDQVNVTKLRAKFKKYITQRFSFLLDGRYIYSQDEGNENENSSQFYKAGTKLAYALTEHHFIFVGYEYSHEYLDDFEELDENGNKLDPHKERSKVWAGVSFNFPM